MPLLNHIVRLTVVMLLLLFTTLLQAAGAFQAEACATYRRNVSFAFDNHIYGSVVTESTILLSYVIHDFEIPQDGYLLFSPNKKDQQKVSLRNTSQASLKEMSMQTCLDQNHFWDLQLHG